MGSAARPGKLDDDAQRSGRRARACSGSGGLCGCPVRGRRNDASLVRSTRWTARRARDLERVAPRNPLRTRTNGPSGSTSLLAYDDEPDRRFPSIYVIQGYTGHITMWRNRFGVPADVPRDRRPGLRAERSATGDVVYVDAWTAYGGSQFVDSTGTGALPLLPVRRGRPVGRQALPHPASREHRGIMGKSSGGFGAMITPMLRPDLFGGLATHAGDALYELCYIPEFGPAVRALRQYAGDIFRWWEDFRSARPSPSGRPVLLSVLGVSACFSARDDGTPELPFDPRTGVLREEPGSAGWTGTRSAWPPGTQTRALSTAIWIDGGTSDEWFLDIGARRSARPWPGRRGRLT